MEVSYYTRESGLTSSSLATIKRLEHEYYENERAKGDDTELFERDKKMIDISIRSNHR